MAFKLIVLTTALFTIAASAPSSQGEEHGNTEDLVGYSYSKFSGPVSGPKQEVIVNDEHGKKHSVDYVAKPDYSYEYGVEDPKSHVSQNHKEYRNGDVVYGEYSLVQPDGVTRTVKYTSDKHNGFQAEVLFDGKPMYEEKKVEHQYEQEHVPEELESHPIEEKSVEHEHEYY